VGLIARTLLRSSAHKNSCLTFSCIGRKVLVGPSFSPRFNGPFAGHHFIFPCLIRCTTNGNTSFFLFRIPWRLGDPNGEDKDFLNREKGMVKANTLCKKNHPNRNSWALLRIHRETCPNPWVFLHYFFFLILGLSRFACIPITCQTIPNTCHEHILPCKT
jgi:hypothetical protein